GETLGREDRVGGPARLGLDGEPYRDARRASQAQVALAHHPMLRPDHQTSGPDARIRQPAQDVVEERPAPADGDHGLESGMGHGGLLWLERDTRIGSAHAGAKPAGENYGLADRDRSHGTNVRRNAPG